MAADRDFWTGVLVLGAGAFGLAAFAASAINQFQPNATRYVVAADQLAGATDGTPVEMSGYELGAVEHVEVLPTPRLHFELTIAVRPDVPIPAGTRVVIASRSVAGGTVLRLVPPEAPADPLPPGATLSATAESTLSDILATGQRTLSNLEAITGELRSVLVDGRPQGSPEGVAGTVRRVNVALDDAHATLASMDALLRKLDATATRAGPAIERDLAQLDRTLATADRVAGNVDRIVAKDGELDVLIRDLADTLAELDAAAKAVQAYDPDGNADMAKMLTQLERASASLDRFMGAFEKKPIRTLTKGVPAEEAP
ncbi:MAG: MlaD family protein [Myxococcota bacterium]